MSRLAPIAILNRENGLTRIGLQETIDHDPSQKNSPQGIGARGALQESESNARMLQ
jgi:hypothetical protein